MEASPAQATHQGGSDRRPDGPLAFMGIANANVAPDGGSTRSTPAAASRAADRTAPSPTVPPTTAPRQPCATKLVQEGGVDVILGGIFSSTRQAIKGPAVVDGKTLYIYPEQYEGEESDPLIFCTGPVPAQQVVPLIPWLMEQDGREEVRPAVSGLHLAPRP